MSASLLYLMTSGLATPASATEICSALKACKGTRRGAIAAANAIICPVCKRLSVTCSQVAQVRLIGVLTGFCLARAKAFIRGIRACQTLSAWLVCISRTYSRCRSARDHGSKYWYAFSAWSMHSWLKVKLALGPPYHLKLK